MFAVSRNVRATGRIRFLRISTITMNLINMSGVPVGIRWVRKFFMKCTHLNNMILVHKIIDMGRFTVIWDVSENTIGKSAIKLKIATVEKMDEIITIPPLKGFLITYKNSFLKNSVYIPILLSINDLFHLKEGKISIRINNETHDVDIILSDGSKIENSLGVNIFII